MTDTVELSPTGNPISDIMSPAEVAKAYCDERIKRCKFQRALEEIAAMDWHKIAIGDGKGYAFQMQTIAIEALVEKWVTQEAD